MVYINMRWEVQFTGKAAKQARQLSKQIFLILRVLVEDLETVGPAPGKHWHHYPKICS